MMTNEEQFADAIVEGLQPVIDRLKALEARLAEVEGRGLKFCGVFQRAATYARGSVVTHSGSAWVALEETRSTPGTDHSWQLLVKRGRDAK